MLASVHCPDSGPSFPSQPEGNTEGPGTASSEPPLPSIVFKLSQSPPLFHDHVTINTNTASSRPSYLLHCPLGSLSSGRMSAWSSPPA